MSDPELHTAADVLPTPFQLALALVIGRSKPSGVTVKGLHICSAFGPCLAWQNRKHSLL